MRSTIRVYDGADDTDEMHCHQERKQTAQDGCIPSGSIGFELHLRKACRAYASSSDHLKYLLPSCNI